MNTLRDLLQESGSNLLVGGVLGKVDGNEKLLSLSVNVANIDTSLVGEEDPVALYTMALVNGSTATTVYLV